MIQLRLTLADGLYSRHIFVFLSKHHPFIVYARGDVTVIKDALHNNGGWEVREPIGTVLDMIEEQMNA